MLQQVDPLRAPRVSSIAAWCASLLLLGEHTPLRAAPIPERREIAIQDQFAPEEVVRDVYRANGFTNDVIVAPQVAFMAEDGTTVEQFIAATDEQILVRLDEFARRNGLGRHSTEVIILDIETPVHLHQYLSRLTEEEFPHVVTALKRRIKLTREFFPNATLGLFGTVIPHPHGDRLAGFNSRRRAYEALAAEGAFDDLDVWVPVLYQRFGWQDAERWAIHLRLDAMTRQGIEEARKLTDSRGRTKPLYPLLSIEIYNTSLHHETQTDPDLMQRQVQIMRCHGVRQWAVWVGIDPMAEIGIADPLEPIRRHTLAEFMQRSVCRADIDGDSRIDNDDAVLFLMLHDRADPRADFNLDGSFDANDINLFAQEFVSNSGICRQHPDQGVYDTCKEAASTSDITF